MRNSQCDQLLTRTLQHMKLEIRYSNLSHTPEMFHIPLTNLFLFSLMRDIITLSSWFNMADGIDKMKWTSVFGNIIIILEKHKNPQSLKNLPVVNEFPAGFVYQLEFESPPEVNETDGVIFHYAYLNKPDHFDANATLMDTIGPVLFASFLPVHHNTTRSPIQKLPLVHYTLEIQNGTVWTESCFLFFVLF